MEFEEGNIYHIYNQGNNRKKLFFSDRNYNFFIEKIGLHISPYCEILAWCLMPNHFHLLVIVNFEKRIINTIERSLNLSIGIMLRSYTRSINTQNNWSGSLFREETKSNLIDTYQLITNGSTNKTNTNKCFNYIIFNPVKDGLVDSPEKWFFSSYIDTIGKIKPRLINIEKIKELDLSINAV